MFTSGLRFSYLKNKHTNNPDHQVLDVLTTKLGDNPCNFWCFFVCFLNKFNLFHFNFLTRINAVKQQTNFLNRKKNALHKSITSDILIVHNHLLKHPSVCNSESSCKYTLLNLFTFFLQLQSSPLPFLVLF